MTKDAEEMLKFERFMRFDTYAPGVDWLQLRNAVLPNLNLLDGISSVNNFDPLVPGDYQQWMDELAKSPEDTKQIVLNLMAVSVVEDMDSMASFDHPHRLRIVPCEASSRGIDEAMQMIFSGEIDSDRQVILEKLTETNLPEQACSPAEYVGEARMVSETPNQLVIEVSSTEDAWLVLSDTDYPGWRAAIDGNPVPIYRANGIFRAVSIHAGTQTVTFKYQPISFYAGALISLVALLVFGVIWWKGQ